MIISSNAFKKKKLKNFVPLRGAAESKSDPRELQFSRLLPPIHLIQKISQLCRSLLTILITRNGWVSFTSRLFLVS